MARSKQRIVKDIQEQIKMLIFATENVTRKETLDQYSDSSCAKQQMARTTLTELIEELADAT